MPATFEIYFRSIPFLKKITCQWALAKMAPPSLVGVGEVMGWVGIRNTQKGFDNCWVINDSV